MTDKRFQQINLPSDIIDTKNSKIYHTLSGNDGYGLCNLLNELHEENEQLKKALWCIRKRYGYTVEEFIEDLKDNGIDLTKVDLE